MRKKKHDNHAGIAHGQDEPHAGHDKENVRFMLALGS
jgi:hypothetical protein